MEEIHIISINAGLHVMLFLYCWWKLKWGNLSTILSCFYAISSLGSLVLFIFPLYYLTFTSNGTPSIQACLYQFTINFLLIMAFSKCSLDYCKILCRYNNGSIEQITKILVVFLGVYLVFFVPSSIASFFSGADLAEMRSELSSNESSKIQLPFIISLIPRAIGSTPFFLISVVSIRYFLLHKFNKWDKAALIEYLIMKIAVILGAISRATIIFSLLEVIVLLILFRSYLSYKLKRLIIRYSLVLIPALMMVFVTITTARFASGGERTLESTLSDLRYTGEAQLNFMNLAYPDLKEPFHGYSQFPLFRRVLGLPYSDGKDHDDESIVINPMIQRLYHYPHPTYVFYGLAGSLYMDWGGVGALLIAFALFVVMRKQFRNPYMLSFMQIIATIMIAAYVAKGVWFCDYSSESGNLLIVYLLLLSFYLKNNGRAYNI